MENEYFHSDVPVRNVGTNLEGDVEFERETFLALLDMVNDSPVFIEICEKSQRLTPYQILMLEGLELDYQAHGELR